MAQMNRRSILKLGAGSAVAAAAAGVPLARHSASQESELLRINATGGLPKPPLPAYATQVIEGTVDVASETGTVTSRVLAGHPGATGAVGLPDLARIIRITKVDVEGSRYRLGGEIEDRSQLHPGEGAHVELVVNKGEGVLEAPFLGQQRALELA